MKISKLLSTDGYNSGLWDLSCSLRKNRVSTEATPGGLMKVGGGQVFVKSPLKRVQAYSLCVCQNEFHSQLECLVSAGPIDFFFPLLTALVAMFPLNTSNSKPREARTSPA